MSLQLAAVIFDMDGVILDNNDWHKKSWGVFARQLGIELKEEDYPTKVYGKTNEQILQQFFPQMTADQLVALSLEKEALYRQMYLPHFKLPEGLMHLVTTLHIAGIPMGLASNAPMVNIDFTLDNGGLRPYFKSIVSASEVQMPKPAPDVYLQAINKLGVIAAKTVIIEDSITGLQAGRAAGAKLVAIASTYPVDALMPHADLVINSFTEIGLQQLDVLVR